MARELLKRGRGVPRSGKARFRWFLIRGVRAPARSLVTVFRGTVGADKDSTLPLNTGIRAQKNLRPQQNVRSAKVGYWVELRAAVCSFMFLCVETWYA